jgi:tetratricopeptide (TPR) repeat protein
VRPARETINETLRLAAEGKFETALALLDRALSDASAEGKSGATLARHAGVIAEQAGDLAAVRRYYEVAAQHDPGPWLCLALGDVCRRLGDHNAARAHYTAGRKLAEDGSDPDVRALLRERTADA